MTQPTTRATLADFQSLPNEARVPISVVCALYACSPPTLYRRLKEKASHVPAPVKDGRNTRWVVGELRAALAR